MGKYRSSAVKVVRERNRQPHYLWRGIGCAMMVIIPVISIAAAVETVKFAFDNGYTIPYQLLGTPRYPDIFYLSRGLMYILRPVTNTMHFYAYAVVSLLYMIALSGIASMGYAIAYRMAGPSRYSPLDAPPPKVKAKPYKR